MKSNTKLFITILQDPAITTKVLIREAVNHGLLRKRGDWYYTSDNLPLSVSNQDPTMEIAAKYLNSPKNQEFKLMLDTKIKALK